MVYCKLFAKHERIDLLSLLSVVFVLKSNESSFVQPIHHGLLDGGQKRAIWVIEHLLSALAGSPPSLYDHLRSTDMVYLLIFFHTFILWHHTFQLRYKIKLSSSFKRFFLLSSIITKLVKSKQRSKFFISSLFCRTDLGLTFVYHLQICI